MRIAPHVLKKFGNSIHGAVKIDVDQAEELA